jgi:hypothetical protein
MCLIYLCSVCCCLFLLSSLLEFQIMFKSFLPHNPVNVLRHKTGHLHKRSEVGMSNVLYSPVPCILCLLPSPLTRVKFSEYVEYQALKMFFSPCFYHSFSVDNHHHPHNTTGWSEVCLLNRPPPHICVTSPWPAESRKFDKTYTGGI